MKRIFFVFFLMAFGAGAGICSIAYAQTSVTTGAVCTDDTSSLPGETTAAKNVRLTADLNECLAEQTAAQATLTQAQNQSSSLQQAINVLNGQIKVAQLNIQAKNLLIATLGTDISNKATTIVQLSGQIQQGQDSLAELLRKTDELGATTLPDVVLSYQNITDIFSDVDTFGSIESSLQSTLDQINANKNQTQTEKDQLTTQQNQQIDARAAIQQDEANIKHAEAAKQTLLNVSKGNEATYSQVLAQKQAKAATIRSALFALAGGGQAIPFGQALQYAQTAGQATGVNPAFLLAILTQESALGANVGNCYVTNIQTGAGISAKTGATVSKVMNPTRDVPVFQTITSILGFDPTHTLVSCPQSIGWGGAMGPAQFIPSTWQLLETRIASALGQSITAISPWNPQDAFTASALYLGDLGARAGSYTSERTAACKYYSGQACGLVRGNTTYATQVLAETNYIQENEINPLEGL
jgi:membrane-bound lytic murein transglycosylase B